MYHLNGKEYLTEALPMMDGSAKSANHKYFAHHYPLANGDVYLITTQGKVMYIAADTEEPECVWEPKPGLAVRYYQPITPALGHSSRFNPCEEQFRGREDYGNAQVANGSYSTRPMSENCLCLLTSDFSCVIFRKGVIIYEGCCDMRGAPKIETRGSTGIDHRTVTVKQEYQWAKDEHGKYLGKGTVLDKTWDWTETHTLLIPVPYGMWPEVCSEYAIGSHPNLVQYSQWYNGAMICPDGEIPDGGGTMTPDKGEFAQHFAHLIWWRCCEPDEECYCVDILARGLDYIDNGLITSVQLLDYQDGYVLVPLKYRVPRFKHTTLLGTVESASELPGVTDSNTLNILD